MRGRPAQPWFHAAKNTWYVWNGDRKVSLGVRGEDNKAEARNAWHRLMANGRTTPEAKAEAPTVAEVVKDFLADAEARLKPATVRGYRHFLDPFAKTHGNLRADRLTPAVAEAYARKPEWSNSTRHDFLSVLAIAFKWAKYPIIGLRKPPMVSRGDKGLVGDEAHARLYEAAPPYFKPFLKLLHLTGARPGEVAAITAENLDVANAVVRLREHKTARHGKNRTIFLCPEAVAVLNEQRARYGSGHLLRNRLGLPYTKNAIVHMTASLRKRAGVSGATAYGYRHAFATDALANGVPDAQVAELLGHSGTVILHRHYSHLTARSQVLRQALGWVRWALRTNEETLRCPRLPLAFFVRKPLPERRPAGLREIPYYPNFPLESPPPVKLNSCIFPLIGSLDGSPRLAHCHGQSPTTKGNGQMKRATLVLAAAALVFGSVGQAKAGLLSPHGQATINGKTGGPQDFTQQVQNDTIFLQNSASNNASGSQFASAIAHTDPSPQFLGGQANVNTSGFIYGASGYATGEWRDVLYLTGSGTLPSTVTFHFTIEGQLVASLTNNSLSAPADAEAVFSAVAGKPSITQPFDYSGAFGASAQIDFQTNALTGSSLTSQGFDPGLKITPDPKTGGYNFTGTISYTATYDPSLGGYAFQVTEGVSSSTNRNASAFAEWNDPLTADFVTNTDGTPLNGFTLSFDSGLQPSASVVPEPSSLALLATASITGFGYFGWRRRGRAAARRAA